MANGLIDTTWKISPEKFNFPSFTVSFDSNNIAVVTGLDGKAIKATWREVFPNAFTLQFQTGNNPVIGYNVHMQGQYSLPSQKGQGHAMVEGSTIMFQFNFSMVQELRA